MAADAWAPTWIIEGYPTLSVLDDSKSELAHTIDSALEENASKSGSSGKSLTVTVAAGVIVGSQDVGIGRAFQAILNTAYTGFPPFASALKCACRMHSIVALSKFC